MGKPGLEKSSSRSMIASITRYSRGSGSWLHVEEDAVRDLKGVAPPMEKVPGMDTRRLTLSLPYSLTVRSPPPTTRCDESRADPSGVVTRPP